MKRSKRLRKGIESLERQRDIHLEKLEKVIEEGDEYLINYYKKELEGIEIEKEKKKELLDR
ncbi:MAG: hypothetical protein KJ592_01565 [Nanoarchaeota archaeon]|nr:hypothetical protein [Nanoarchaeota archaeon]